MIYFFKYRWRFFILLAFPWFFIGGPDYESSRVIKEGWNLGHILFFAVFAFEADRCWTARVRTIRAKYISITLLVLALATSIEVCQAFISGRVASFQDIIFGLIGGLVILVWKYAEQQSSGKNCMLRAVGICGIAVCMIPLLFVVIDEYRAWHDFPVLSDFESFLEVSRWGGNGRVARVGKPVKNGKFALMVPLSTDKYSGIALEHFPEDWSNARALTLFVYNPGEMVTLHYRIHDRKHRGRNQEYSERFNGHTDLTSGWNTITISMKEIENGPKNRKTDLAHINGVGIFVTEQPVTRILYFDYVNLIMNENWQHE